MRIWAVIICPLLISWFWVTSGIIINTLIILKSCITNIIWHCIWYISHTRIIKYKPSCISILLYTVHTLIYKLLHILIHHTKSSKQVVFKRLQHFKCGVLEIVSIELEIFNRQQAIIISNILKVCMKKRYL